MNEPSAEPKQPSGAQEASDVLVVGGGLAGLLAAWRAAAAGLRTLVLDAADRPAAAGVAAGMIAPVGEASWGEERLLELACDAAERWPGFAADLEAAAGRQVPYARRGALHVALDRDEAVELRRRDRLLDGAGLDFEPLLGSAARSLEPALATGVTAATEAPLEAEVDPRALLAALRAAAGDAGAEFVKATVVQLDPEGAARTSGGHRFEAERVLLAAGAWAGQDGLLPGAQRLPVRPVKGVILRLRAERGALPCERIIVGERFYLVPRAGGELVLGASTEERGFDLRVTAGAVHELLREAYRALPELAELELVETAAGLRPGSPGNEPIFGAIAGSRIAVVAGLYRNGVLLAPVLAAGLDALYRGEEPPPPLAALAPGRQPGERAGERVS